MEGWYRYKTVCESILMNTRAKARHLVTERRQGPKRMREHEGGTRLRRSA